MSTRDWRAAYNLDKLGPFRCGAPKAPRERTTREERSDAIRRAGAALHVREFLQDKRSAGRTA